MASRNKYLDDGISDESDSGAGYDSEREVSKASRSKSGRISGRATKRRKLSHSSSESENEIEESFLTARDHVSPIKKGQFSPETAPKTQPKPEYTQDAEEESEEDLVIKSAATSLPSKPSATLRKSKKKERTPGVVYLSSLPPYLKPSALRNLLSQRGFEPITRLFLTPVTKHKHASKKNSRQLYSEGWIEFASKKTARRCAEALNAQIVGGRKGGFYHDDLWNMKYLKSMQWDELMAGIREERREEDGRRDEERRRLAAETKAFVEGVEEGKRVKGMERKRKARSRSENVGDEDVKRTWRQFEVVGNEPGKRGRADKDNVDPSVQAVLSKIF